MKTFLQLKPSIAYKHYKRYKRKYIKLLQDPKSSADKLDFLRKRILRLKDYLQDILLKFKLGTAAGALGLMLFTANTSKAQIYAAPLTNPFGLIDIGEESIPSLADIDNDGDLDLITGERYGDFKYFQNIGSSSAPAFATAVINPFGLTNIGYASTPVFVDLDNDGDMDILSGEQFGNFKYFQNTGTASAPSFTTVLTNPFGLADVGFSSQGSFADLDFDGDLDFLAGEKTGNWKYFQNTGTPYAPAFSAMVTNPFGLADVGYGYSSPIFVDLDFDGDMDLMSGEYYGDFKYFQNTGTRFAPAFAAMVANPFSLTVPGNITNPTLADLDNDGDYDVVVGMITGDFKYYENVCASASLGTMGSIVGPDIVCPNSTNSYSVSPASGAVSYSWFVGSGWSGSSSTNTVSVTSFTNNAPLKAIANKGCKGRINTKFISVAALPSLTITASPSTTICAGQTATVTVSGAATYTWNTGDFTPDIVVNPSGSTMYTVTGTSGKGCVNSKTFNLIIDPFTPTISVVGNPGSSICSGQTATLTASGGSSYSWNTGATTSNIIVNPTSTTMYTVTGTSSGGCSVIKTFNLIVEACTGIKENTIQYLTVYPNPSNGLLHVDLSSFKEGATIQIINSLGEVILNETIHAEKSAFDFQHLSNGIYFVRVSQQDKQQTIKVIKE